MQPLHISPTLCPVCSQHSDHTNRLLNYQMCWQHMSFPSLINVIHSKRLTNSPLFFKKGDSESRRAKAHRHGRRLSFNHLGGSLCFLGLNFNTYKPWRSGLKGPFQGKLSRYVLYQSQTNFSFNLLHLEIQLVSILNGQNICLEFAYHILCEEGSLRMVHSASADSGTKSCPMSGGKRL